MSKPDIHARTTFEDFEEDVEALTQLEARGSIHILNRRPRAQQNAQHHRA